jgi:hypothetical protein
MKEEVREERKNLHNEELHELYSSSDTVKMMRTMRTNEARIARS